MDVIMMHPKKNKIVLLGQKSKLTDFFKELKTGKMVSVQQDGKNKIAIMGTAFVKPYVLIQSHGDLDCKKTSCVSKIPDATFIPSKKAVQSTELSRRILNTYVSSLEGFLNKEIVMKKERRFVPAVFENVKGLKVSYLKNNFLINIGNEKIVVDQFLLDPVIVDSARVNKGESMLDVITKDAHCAMRKDSMSTPSRTVLFCSNDATKNGAYKLKSFLSIYKEQLNSARGMQLKSMEHRNTFGLFPRCHTSGSVVCCQVDDEEEICY